MTNDLVQRVEEHKGGLQKGFTRRYGVHQLVYFEAWASGRDAITREKRLKKWNRQWKINLIESFNPEWKDLFDVVAGGVSPHALLLKNLDSRLRGNDAKEGRGNGAKEGRGNDVNRGQEWRQQAAGMRKRWGRRARGWTPSGAWRRLSEFGGEGVRRGNGVRFCQKFYERGGTIDEAWGRLLVPRTRAPGVSTFPA